MNPRLSFTSSRKRPDLRTGPRLPKAAVDARMRARLLPLPAVLGGAGPGRLAEGLALLAHDQWVEQAKQQAEHPDRAEGNPPAVARRDG